MKPIALSGEEKEKLIQKFVAQLSKSLDSYTFDSSTKFTFETKVGEKLKDKIDILYAPQAYLRMKRLVDSFSSEVSWFGLVKKLSPKQYYVYDVLVPKQYVDGAKVDTTDEDMLEFYSNLTDEQAEFMHFQAHSHVNFDTIASGTDMTNQMDILSNIPGKQGFYIFQIWNKRGSINTFLYDLDENRFYDKDDVNIVVSDSEYGSLDNFIAEAEKLVGKIQSQTTWYGTYNGNGYAQNYAGGSYGYYQGWPSSGKNSRYLYGMPDYDAKGFVYGMEEDDMDGLEEDGLEEDEMEDMEDEVPVSGEKPGDAWTGTVRYV